MISPQQHTNPQSTHELLIRWTKRLRESQFAHYEAAKQLGRLNYFLGIPAVSFSTIVGTAVFSSLGESVIPEMQILVGIISVLSATLAALQTFLGFSERAEKHRSIAVSYGTLRRQLEEVLVTFDTISQDQVGEKITSIRLDIDKLAKDAPNVSDHIWNKTKKILQSS